MFSKDKNRFKVNIKAAKASNVLDFSAAQKRAAKEKKKKDQPEGLWGKIGPVDLRTPWVIRLLAVIFILILSMLVL